MYDYTATIDEEFDFQAGDVIAVTATPDDGWWSGELLDEERREEGRRIFPSNFVCMYVFCKYLHIEYIFFCIFQHAYFALLC